MIHVRVCEGKCAGDVAGSRRFLPFGTLRQWSAAKVEGEVLYKVRHIFALIGAQHKPAVPNRGFLARDEMSMIS